MSLSKEEVFRLMREAIRQEKVEAANSGQSQETHASHILSCPECFKETIKKIADSEYICANCGLGLGDFDFARKFESCPNCGKTEAMKAKKSR